MPNRYRPWTMADVRRACELRGRGLSYPEIGAVMGRRYQVVQRVCRRHGEPPGPREADRLPRQEGLLRELHARGLCVAQIARELRCGRTTVYRHLARLGLPSPAPCRGRHAVSEAARERMAVAAADRHRRTCAALGWPEVTVPAQARVLRLLRERGPLTHRQIAQALGWRLYASRGNPHLCRHLRALTTPAAGRRDGGARAWNERHVKGGLPGLVVRLPGGPPLYQISDWLMARKNEERA